MPVKVYGRIVFLRDLLMWLLGFSPGFLKSILDPLQVGRALPNGCPP